MTLTLSLFFFLRREHNPCRAFVFIEDARVADMTMSMESVRISRMVARLDFYPNGSVIRVNWRDGSFCLLCIEELRVALRSGKIFNRGTDEINSLELQGRF